MSLKGYGCICFGLSLHLLSVGNGVNNDFQNHGLIFKTSKFSNWHKNFSSPKIQTFFYFFFLLNSWFDASSDHT